MSTNGTTVSPALPVYTKKDFESGVDPRWCPGCGDFSIINQVQKTMPSVGVFTRPIPMTPRAPGAKSVLVAVRVSDRLKI